MTQPHSGYYSCNASEIIKNSMLYAVGSGLCNYSAGDNIRFINADHYIIAVVIEGKLNCRAYGVQKTLTKNMLVFLPPRILESVSCIQNACVQIISFDGPPASGYRSLLGSDNEFIYQLRDINNIRSAISEITEIIRSRSDDPAKISLLLTTILTYLCTSSVHEVRDPEKNVIDRSLQRILHCIANPPSVQTLAEEAGYSQSHFIRVFSRNTGLTPRQYIISIRIIQAKHLLSTTALSLRSIAEMVGYTSESMFCSAFKSVTDMTPGEYREAAARKSQSENSEMLRIINDAIIDGNYADIGRLCKNALDAGCSDSEIISSMIQSMRTANDLYVCRETLLSEMLSSAKAVKYGLHVIRSDSSNSKTFGTAIIGTASGDFHDIGKNLVALMLEAVGFEIIDLGVDVSSEVFISTWHDHPGTRLIVISSLLSSSRTAVKNAVQCINGQPDRNNIAVLVGGGAITEEFALDIGADAYTADAVSAAFKARELVMGENLNA